MHIQHLVKYVAGFVFIVLNSKHITFRSFIKSIKICTFYTLPCKSNEENSFAYKVHTMIKSVTL